MKRTIFVCGVLGLLAGCPNPYQVAGPEECMNMCQGWDLEFAGMVGVGSGAAEGRHGSGASACVCQVARTAGGSAAADGAAGTASGLVAPITAAQAAAAQQLMMQQYRTASTNPAVVR